MKRAKVGKHFMPLDAMALNLSNKTTCFTSFLSASDVIELWRGGGSSLGVKWNVRGSKK